MIEIAIALAIVLLSMCGLLAGLALSSNGNSAYKPFFVILAVWMLFLTLNVIRHSSNTVEYFSESRQFDAVLMNSSGTPVLFKNLNLSTNTTRYVNLTNSTLGLLDSANQSWLWIAVLITGLEVVYLIFLALTSFGGGVKPPRINPV